MTSARSTSIDSARFVINTTYNYLRDSMACFMKPSPVAAMVKGNA